MNTSVEQQNFPSAGVAPSVYADSDQAVVEKPGNPYYTDGVDVGYTAPAKWWNWLWRHVTTWLKDSKTDREAMRAEMSSTLTAASISASDADNHQLSKAVDTVAFADTGAYDNEEVTEEVGGMTVMHKKNRPYVVGNTLYIPSTELL